jgi:transforming growth factor-beta-induced protein
MKIMQITQFVLALATSATLVACGGGGDSPTAAPQAADLGATVQSAEGARSFSTAVDAAGMATTMRTASALTALVPSDGALAAYGDDLAELEQPQNQADLQDYVKAHLVDGRVLSQQLTDAAAAADAAAAQPAGNTQAAGAAATSVTVKNLLGEDLEVEVSDGVLTVNGAEVLKLDVLATNGVCHQFKAPLFGPSVFSVVKRNPQTSTLEAAIRAAGLQDTLRGKGRFTLFAPTNAAFAALLKELNLTADQLLANKPLLTEVLTYHVLASKVLARQIADGSTPATVEGQSVQLNATGKGRKRQITLTDARGRTAKVVQADIQARNGVVHLIDRVILPSDKSVVAIAAGDPRFSILVEAVTAAGLVDTLSGKGPFTVFAPTNDAFSALLAELHVTKEALLADKPLLTDVLTYHVLSGRVLANDLTDGLALKPLEGQPVKVQRSAAGVALKDGRGRVANVIITNVQGTNGVVHAIDKVILPTASNLVQVAQATPDLSILVEAVVAADLAGTLSGPGPFTVFAPTNAAFVSLLGELGVSKAALLADKALLTKVLTYHVLPAQVLSSGIPFGAPVATVEGETLTISRALKITDQRGRQSNIVATDVAATNGVVHLIDRVILPK